MRRLSDRNCKNSTGSPNCLTDSHSCTDQWPHRRRKTGSVPEDTLTAEGSDTRKKKAGALRRTGLHIR